ncbi:hypothetical protein [Pseudophaeobacter arcticus]|jgi:hypothetical protein|uniref:hypothetical protein n=1 Tax=Pseudophaeobacter arcticus TaxID=385492 RepID=UPI000423A577|nr:hypothetical protein [Pseudophaeobacter arcticus]
MSANQNLTAALAILHDQLEALKTLTDANEFMVTALKEQGDALKTMEAEPARELLRLQARAQFSPEQGASPDAAVLNILEQSLGKGLGAEIIPFPGAAVKQSG